MIVLRGACLSRIDERVDANCSEKAESEDDGLEYREDVRISFEKSVVLIAEYLRIALSTRGGRCFADIGR